MTGQIHPEERPVSAMLERELKRVERGIRFRQTLRSTAFTLVIVAAVAVLVATLMLPVLQIYGASMAPTLCEGELVISVKTAHIEPGQLVAFYYGNKVLIKRCIGLEGDWIDIDPHGVVSVNGVPLDEPYLEEKVLGECDLELPYQVPDGRIFVMGDHRATSIDSRNTLVGCVSSEQLLGRVVLRFWPLSRFGPIQ